MNSSINRKVNARKGIRRFCSTDGVNPRLSRHLFKILLPNKEEYRFDRKAKKGQPF